MQKISIKVGEPKALSMDVPRAFISGRNVRVLWSLPKSYSFSNRITSFQIEFRTESDDKKWILGDIVDEHVRAVTINTLLPGNRLDNFFSLFVNTDVASSMRVFED